MFKEVALFERLEARFIERIDEAGGPTLVTMFQAHGAWAAHVVDEVLVKKKQKKRVYKIFKKYHDLFYEHCVVNLIKKADEITVKYRSNFNVHATSILDFSRISHSTKFKSVNLKTWDTEV